MMQAAMLDLEHEESSGSVDEPNHAEMEEQFEHDLELAGSGDWEALGLDAPGADERPGFVPVTVESFLEER